MFGILGFKLCYADVHGLWFVLLSLEFDIAAKCEGRIRVVFVTVRGSSVWQKVQLASV